MKHVYADLEDDLAVAVEGGSLFELFDEAAALCKKNGRHFCQSMVKVFADYDGHLIIKVDDDCPVIGGVQK